MVARLFGIVLLGAGLLIVLRARHICDWSARLDRDWFGWDPPPAVRAYGLAATITSGVMVAVAGLTYVVQGVGALPS